MALTAAQVEEIKRKANSNIPLAGNGSGVVSSESLALYQQITTANAAAAAANSSNQSTGGGVGVTVPTTPTYPGNTILPDNISSAVKGYGFTAVVGLGALLLIVSIMSSFKRVRGR